MKSNTNPNPKTETPLAHLDVDKVADMLIAAYDLGLDNEYNIVDSHTDWVIDDYEPLVEYLASSIVCPIDDCDDYNAQWLDALFICLRLKLMCKTGGHSTYIADKLEGVINFLKDVEYDEDAIDSISDRKERQVMINAIYHDYRDYVACKYPAMWIDEFLGYWNSRDDLVNEK